MDQLSFIFSNKRKFRLRRHFVFWTAWWIFSAVLYSFSPANDVAPTYFHRLLFAGVDSLLYLVPQTFFAYSLMYIVGPKLLAREKYVGAAVSTIILVFCTAVVSAFIGIHILNPLWKTLLTDGAAKTKSPLFFTALLAGLRGSITIGGFAAAIKLVKHLYLKEQKNLELQKQNMAAQLQLLKAQVHPHFLFNTLNNIYSFTQVSSPKAARVVAGLSDLLRHMLYECDQPLVPLKQELKILQDYIILEQIRYDDQLDLSISIDEVDDDLLIPPLLMLPFVENSFKHGASQLLENPWVSLTISVQGNVLKMKLVNGKHKEVKTRSSGIGIANVKSRLELIYPGKHLLRISETQDNFIVNLTVELERSGKKNAIPKAVVYA